MPVISGMFQSDSTSSGSCRWTACSPSSPLPASTSWWPVYPAWRSVRATICRITRLSSTIRIFIGPPDLPLTIRLTRRIGGPAVVLRQFGHTRGQGHRPRDQPVEAGDQDGAVAQAPFPEPPDSPVAVVPAGRADRDVHGARAVLVLVALLALAFNLRPAASSVGPLVEEVERGLGLSSASAGLLTALPVLSF